MFKVWWVSDDHFVGDLFVSVMVKQLWKLSNIEFTGSWVQHFFDLRLPLAWTFDSVWIKNCGPGCIQWKCKQRIIESTRRWASCLPWWWVMGHLVHGRSYHRALPPSPVSGLDFWNGAPNVQFTNWLYDRKNVWPEKHSSYCQSFIFGGSRPVWTNSATEGQLIESWNTVVFASELVQTVALFSICYVTRTSRTFSRVLAQRGSTALSF